jgi:hypothetical protein
MQALRLNWPKCRKGYEILEIRRAAIGLRNKNFRWNASSVATDHERRLMAKWDIGPYAFEEGEETVRIIEPRDESKQAANVLASAPDLFVQFANINGSEEKLLNFVIRHGPLHHDSPQYVSSGLEAAAEFQEVLVEFENAERTGSKRWLSSYQKYIREDLTLEETWPDLKVVAEISGRKAQVWLEPPNLLMAIWIQFLLKAADDMALTHCHSCGNFIAVASSLGRSDKRFCSTACKQRDYRKREAEKSSRRAKGVGAGRITKRRHSK